MNCPYCSSSATTRLAKNTSLGYPAFQFALQDAKLVTQQEYFDILLAVR